MLLLDIQKLFLKLSKPIKQAKKITQELETEEKQNIFDIMVKSIGMSQKNYLAIYHKKLVSLPE